eukprot:m51a1_g5309 hypothetical protein (477) ;mRNA; r:283196-284699
MAEEPPKMPPLRITSMLAMVAATAGSTQLSALALPHETRRLAPASASELAGAIGALGSALSLLALAFGAASDRLRPAGWWGRRRPFVLASALGLVAAWSLWAAASWAESLPCVAAAYALVQLCVACGQTATMALVSDALPAAQHGLANGVVSLLTIAGAALVYALFLAGLAVWHCAAALACASLALPLATLRCAVEGPRARKAERPGLWRELRGFAFDPREHADWALLLAERFGALYAAGFLQALQYFLADCLGAADALRCMSLAGVAMLALVAAASLPAGLAADRWGRRAPLAACLALMCAALAATALARRLWAALALVGAFAVGQGVWYAVEGAVSYDVLPCALDAGKHVALLSVVGTLAAVASQLVNGLVLAAFPASSSPSSESSQGSGNAGAVRAYAREGYQVLFGSSAAVLGCCAVLGALISPARGKAAQRRRDAAMLALRTGDVGLGESDLTADLLGGEQAAECEHGATK